MRALGVGGLGAGFAGIGAPRANNGACKRFIHINMASGCIPGRYWPSSGTRFNYSTEPLERHASDIAIMRGVHMPHRGDHRPFVVATGSGDRDGLIAAHPSLDQLIVNELRATGYDRPTLALAGQTKNSKPQGHISFDLNGNPVTPVKTPRTAFENVFGRPPMDDSGMEPAPTGPSAEDRVEEALYETLLSDLDDIERQLGPEERQQVEAHREALSRMLGGLGGVSGPVLGESIFLSEPNGFLDRCMQHMDLITLAFASDQRRVASFLMTPLGHDNMSRNSYRTNGYDGSLPGLSSADEVGDVSGDLHQRVAHGWSGNSDYAEAFARISRAENAVVAYLIDRLKATPDPINGGGTVFDNTAIYVTNEHAGPNHGVNAGRSDFPTIPAAGKDMGLRVGDYVTVESGGNLHGNIVMAIA
ncbi:MAG: DUF1552 domain-containing protein, partial [Myxococcota bacterium]